MSQLYSNNVDTTLAAPLSDSATSATLTDGSGLQSPTGGDFELITLSDAGLYEVVKVTARSANVVTIQRAQDGTVAQGWNTGARVFAGVTAGTLERLIQNDSANTGALAIGGATATANNSVSIGSAASASAADQVVIGRLADSSGSGSLAVGNNAEALAEGAVALGIRTFCDGLYTSIAIGDTAWASDTDAIAIGWSSDAAGAESVAIGMQAATVADHVFVTSALPAVTGSPTAQSTAAWRNSAAGVVITSNVLNLKNAQTYQIPLPAGVTFFPDEVGVLIVAADTVTVQPTVQFGINLSAQEYLDAVATTGLSAAGDRQRFQTLKTAKGTATLRFEVTVGATATTLTGRIYWRGFAVEG